AGGADEPVRVIVTLRDDFLVRVQQLPALRERIGHSLQLLSTPPAEELERILVEPARRAGYEFEDDTLAGEMVAEVADQPSALALLSFTAAKLWQLRDRQLRQLPRRAYRALGGVGGALANHAEELLAEMPARRRDVVREAFRQLITAEGTRAVLSRSELVQLLERSGRSGQVSRSGQAAPDAADGGGDRVLEALIAARLLVASEGEGGEDRIEVVHEALLSSWPRLVRWQREDAESARMRDQLRAAARQWNDRGRPRGLLWRGEALLEYRVWRGRYPGALTAAEDAFARASVSDEARGRRLRRAAVLLAFAVVVVGLFAVWQQRERARGYAAEAALRLVELYREQGRQALLAGDPMRAFVYLREARREGADDVATRFMLARTLDRLAGQELVLAGHDGVVTWAEFSNDGQRIATAAWDGRVAVWDGATGQRLVDIAAHDATAWVASFSPDGTRLATCSSDRTVKVWDAASGALVWTGNHAGRVSWLGYTGDGSAVLSVSHDQTARLWDAATGRLRATYAGHSKPVVRAALSPDDSYLITGSGDGSARIWDRDSGRERATIADHRGRVDRVAIAPSGAQVATASWSGLARVAPAFGGPAIDLLVSD
ncbi:MAG: WD40 repeat domain-containing protein, partial [Myxococcota bacterium]